MRTIKQVNMKNHQKYFFHDMTNIDPSLLNMDRVSYESNESIKYSKNLNSSNSLYLAFNDLDAYIEKSGKNKYLIFASTDKNGRALENYIGL